MVIPIINRVVSTFTSNCFQAHDPRRRQLFEVSLSHEARWTAASLPGVGYKNYETMARKSNVEIRKSARIVSAPTFVLEIRPAFSCVVDVAVSARLFHNLENEANRTEKKTEQ